MNNQATTKNNQAAAAAAAKAEAEASATREWPAEAEDIKQAYEHAAKAKGEAEEAEKLADDAELYAAGAEAAASEAETYIERLQEALERKREEAEEACAAARSARAAAKSAREQANYAIATIGAYHAARSAGETRSQALQQAATDAIRALGVTRRTDTEGDIRDGGGDCGLSNAVGCLYENAREEREAADHYLDAAEDAAALARKELDE